MQNLLAILILILNFGSAFGQAPPPFEISLLAISASGPLAAIFSASPSASSSALNSIPNIWRVAAIATVLLASLFPDVNFFAGKGQT
jgi:hypothetical protein